MFERFKRLRDMADRDWRYSGDGSSVFHYGKHMWDAEVSISGESEAYRRFIRASLAELAQEKLWEMFPCLTSQSTVLHRLPLRKYRWYRRAIWYLQSLLDRIIMYWGYWDTDELEIDWDWVDELESTWDEPD